MKSLPIFLTAAVAGTYFCTVPAEASILAYENFGTSHALGSAIADNGDGFGWAASWVGSGATYENLATTNPAFGATTINPSGGLNGYISSSNGRVARYLDTSGTGALALDGYIDANGNIGADGKTLYLAFTMSSTAADRFYGFELHKDGEGDSQRILQVATQTANAPGLDFIATGGTSQNDFYTPTLDTGTYFVLRLDFTSDLDTATLFVNPLADSLESSNIGFSVTSSDLSFDNLGFASYYVRNVSFDNITVATSWNDIVAVPEPEHYWAFGLAFLIPVVVRNLRRRNHEAA